MPFALFTPLWLNCQNSKTLLSTSFLSKTFLISVVISSCSESRYFFALNCDNFGCLLPRHLTRTYSFNMFKKCELSSVTSETDDVLCTNQRATEMVSSSASSKQRVLPVEFFIIAIWDCAGFFLFFVPSILTSVSWVALKETNFESLSFFLSLP